MKCVINLPRVSNPVVEQPRVKPVTLQLQVQHATVTLSNHRCTVHTKEYSNIELNG